MTPDEIFDAAVTEARPGIAFSDMQLFLSGLAFLREAQEKRLNDIELKAVSNMIAYVAYEQKICEATVEAILLTRFGGEAIESLSSHLFQPMIDFLANLKKVQTVN